MCSNEEDNAGQLRIFSSGKSYVSGISSVWPSDIVNIAEDIQYRFVSYSAQLRMCSMQLSQIGVRLSHIISITGDMQYR